MIDMARRVAKFSAQMTLNAGCGARGLLPVMSGQDEGRREGWVSLRKPWIANPDEEREAGREIIKGFVEDAGEASSSRSRTPGRN